MTKQINTVVLNDITVEYIIMEDDDMVVYWYWEPTTPLKPVSEPVIAGTFFGACEGEEYIKECLTTLIVQ